MKATKEMTRQQKMTCQTGLEKTNANVEAITEEIVIANEARPANAQPPLTKREAGL